MNFLKSVCSFAKSTPVTFHQLQQNVHPLLRSQVRVELIVGPLRVVETSENLNDAVHARNCSTRDAFTGGGGRS
jgi:hypothetical protein